MFLTKKLSIGKLLTRKTSILINMEVHGDFKIIKYKHSLDVKIIGQWNYEGAIGYIDKFKKAASSISQNDWGVIVDLREWELGTPETERPIAELQFWCKDNNQRYEATVIGDKDIRRFQMDKYLETLDRNSIEQKYFKNYDDAIKWFQELDLF